MELLVAALTVLSGSAAAALLTRLHTRRDERRLEYSRALEALAAWAEMPYRIARRQDRTPEIRQALADEFNNVQRQVVRSEYWLTIDDERVGQLYRALFAAISHHYGPLLTESWVIEPVREDEDMNLSQRLNLPHGEPREIAEARQAFSAAAHHRLSWFSRLRRRPLSSAKLL